MQELLFARAQPEDLPIVLSILNEGTARKLALGDNSWSPEGWSPQRLAGFMAESRTYLVHQGGILAATYAVQWEDNVVWGEQPGNASYLHRMVTRQDFRGQGLGPKMVSHATWEAAAAGYELLRLDCPADNEGLCAYYRDLGFSVVGSCFVAEYGDYNGVLFECEVA